MLAAEVIADGVAHMVTRPHHGKRRKRCQMLATPAPQLDQRSRAFSSSLA